MKKFLAKMNYWELIIGIFIGMFLGLAVFSALVPSGVDMIKLYHLEKGGPNNKPIDLSRVSTSTKDFEIGR